MQDGEWTDAPLHLCMRSCKDTDRTNESEKMNRFVHLCKTCVTRGAGRRAEPKQTSQTCHGSGQGRTRRAVHSMRRGSRHCTRDCDMTADCFKVVIVKEKKEKNKNRSSIRACGTIETFFHLGQGEAASALARPSRRLYL